MNVTEASTDGMLSEQRLMWNGSAKNGTATEQLTAKRKRDRRDGAQHPTEPKRHGGHVEQAAQDETEEKSRGHRDISTSTLVHKSNFIYLRTLKSSKQFFSILTKLLFQSRLRT